MPSITLPGSAEASASRTTTIVWSAIFMTCVMILSVALRLLSRRLTRTPLGWDDWLCMVALPLAVAGPVVCIIAVYIGGFGKHTELSSNTVAQLHRFLICLFVDQLAYLWTVALVRASLICLYQRIFPSRVTSRLFTWAIWTTHSLNIGWLTWSVFVVIFDCNPVSGAWNFELNPQCIDQRLVFLISAFQGFALDFMVLALPVFVIRSLQLNSVQKLALIGTFCVGIVATAGGILRVNTIIHEDLRQDPTWVLVDTGLWTYVETGLGLFCACIPTLRPLLNYLSGKSMLSTNKSDNSIRSRLGILSCLSACEGRAGHDRAHDTDASEQGFDTKATGITVAGRMTALNDRKRWWQSNNSTRAEASHVEASRPRSPRPSDESSSSNTAAHGAPELVDQGHMHADEGHLPPARPVASTSQSALGNPSAAAVPFESKTPGTGTPASRSRVNMGSSSRVAVDTNASRSAIRVQQEYSVAAEDR